MKKTNLVKKLILTLSSMMVCMVLIGVSVYAAISQTATLNNSIIISADGQARAKVEVYEQIVAEGENAITELDGATLTNWGTVKYTKASTENQGNCNNLTAIEFNQTTNNNIYAYKIVVTSESTVPLEVSIASSTESNTQIDVYCGTELNNLTKLDNGKAIDLKNAELAKGGTYTYYVVLCANQKLADMTEVDNQDFDITVTIEV